MKIICIGRNYSDHIKELANIRPSHPVVFLKPDSSIIPKNQNFIIPAFSDEIHHEVELVVKINKVGKHIDKSFSNKYYNEIGLGIDFTARDIQNTLKQKGHPWEKSKAFDNSCLVGDFISVDKFKDLSKIDFSLKKNNQLAQSGNSSNMLWKIDELISYVSQYFTLKIGDLIFTGTPAGVSKVISGDLLEGYIDSTKMFSLKIK
jgi:2-keto-4-pentenoate hydratase/2-oxohepta-3-ene-1,7-dioic acid hydratase in catechol pathway